MAHVKRMQAKHFKSYRSDSIMPPAPRAPGSWMYKWEPDPTNAREAAGIDVIYWFNCLGEYTNQPACWPAGRAGAFLGFARGFLLDVMCVHLMPRQTTVSVRGTRIRSPGEGCRVPGPTHKHAKSRCWTRFPPFQVSTRGAKLPAVWGLVINPKT